MYSRDLARPRRIARGEFPSLALDAKGGVYLAWELARGLGFAFSGDRGERFQVTSPVPGSAQGPNGGLQGKLGRKLAVTPDGQVALVNSRFREGEASRVWLLRGGPTSRSSLGPG